MTHAPARSLALLLLAPPLALAACGVPQDHYDPVQTQNQRLQQRVAATPS